MNVKIRKRLAPTMVLKIPTRFERGKSMVHQSAQMVRIRYFSLAHEQDLLPLKLLIAAILGRSEPGGRPAPFHDGILSAVPKMLAAIRQPAQVRSCAPFARPAPQDGFCLSSA